MSTPPAVWPCLGLVLRRYWLNKERKLSGIVEMAIVFMLGVAVGYAWRDRISRARRLKDRERWRTRRSALKYNAGPPEPLQEKWTESLPETPPADSVARSDGDSASRKASD